MLETDRPTILDVVITSMLLERPAPDRDIAAEHRALTDLVRRAATDSSRLLPSLVDVALRLCGAGSCGVSLLEPGAEPGQGVFRWVAMSGAFEEYVGGTTPESFSPCGFCLDRGSAQLYRRPARVFTYLAQATPPIVEGLVIPLRSDVGPLGTIWIVSHDDAVEFTARDVDVMTSLADFTSAALALQRARDDAESANRAKDEFLAVVSHELRRPLTAIVGWSELLLSGRSSPAMAARAIEALYINARRQQDMIDDLLDAARTATGNLRVQEEMIDLADVVRSAVEVVAAAASDKRVEIVSQIAESLPFRGDPQRLHQVIANLLSNAVKFTPSGGCVFVEMQVSHPSVIVTVRDTGIGLEPSALAGIFDAFRKVDASSTRRDSGLGLGLTIARRLASLHDGTLEAQSDGEGRGATFTLRLPAVRLHSESTLLSYAPPDSRPFVPRGVSVLVVDDEPDVRDLLTGVLEEAGITVLTAAGVDEALSVLDAQPVDVLVTDLVMPGRDGYALISELRRRAPNPAIVAIALTALACWRERQRAFAAGFDHHIAKPVNVTALLRVIAEATAAERPH